MAAAPVFVADAKGFWKEENLQVELKPFASGRLALDALVGKTVHAATVSEVPVVFAAFQQQEVRIICTFTNSEKHVNLLARRDRGISAPNDLRGKKIAVSLGTAAEYVMDTFLEPYGITRSEIKIVALNPPDTVAAITRGDVDAIFAWQPYIYNAQKQLGDNAVIFPSGEKYNHPFSIIVMQNHINQGKPELKKLINGLRRAERFMKENREESIIIVANKLGVGTQDIADIWDDYSFQVGLDPNLADLLEKEGIWAKRIGVVAQDTREPDYRSIVFDELVKDPK